MTDLKPVGQYEYLHAHWYAGTVTGGRWFWCGKCQCMVDSKCDHRSRICRERKNKISREEAQNE